MAVTDQLGAPAKATRQEGRYSLNRIVLSEASAASPVTPTNMSHIVGIDISEPTFDSNLIFQQGGGDERTEVRRNWRWNGTITVLKGKKPNVLASLQNLTWDTSNDAAISTRIENDLPHVHWEAVCRDSDNSTHLFTLLIQDMIIDNSGFSNPMDYSDETINFHTYHEPVWLCLGSEVVYDVIATDGSSTDFALSSTPLNLLTASSHDDWDLDELVFVKVKASGESTGTRQRSGISYAGGNATFTTAPAASGVVQLLYAKKT